MLKKIDHIGIAVQNLDEVIRTYQDSFDLEPDFQEEIENQKVKIAVYKIGDSTIEYLEPVSENSPVTKFLEKRGNGIHHIAFQVENLEEKIRELVKKGYSVIDEKQNSGAHSKKIAFLHPKSFNGILIELCEF